MAPSGPSTKVVLLQAFDDSIRTIDRSGTASGIRRLHPNHRQKWYCFRHSTAPSEPSTEVVLLQAFDGSIRTIDRSGTASGIRRLHPNHRQKWY
ncbi:hypothetical protein AVEN_245235-1 [Araneus ventricosus]|uniref:Uncharacterized protein n=1 Tax=Araneus ventricosus TaxID=182803 RepID=A0A4Y2VSI0_ARAVE|nr:hypothetical protein AVEN_245235-1 [Araneus ventricosus]